MTRSIYEPTLWRATAKNAYGVKRQQQKPGAFKWWTPDCDDTDPDQAAAGCTGEEPTLQNGWAQPAAPLELFAFRLHSDGSLEFKGHLDPDSASSGTVAVTLPGANPGEVDFRPAHDQFFLTVLEDETLARVYIEASSGDVTIFFPVS